MSELDDAALRLTVGSGRQVRICLGSGRSSCRGSFHILPTIGGEEGCAERSGAAKLAAPLIGCVEPRRSRPQLAGCHVRLLRGSGSSIWLPGWIRAHIETYVRVCLFMYTRMYARARARAAAVTVSVNRSCGDASVLLIWAPQVLLGRDENAPSWSWSWFGDQLLSVLLLLWAPAGHRSDLAPTCWRCLGW